MSLAPIRVRVYVEIIHGLYIKHADEFLGTMRHEIFTPGRVDMTQVCVYVFKSFMLSCEDKSCKLGSKN